MGFKGYHIRNIDNNKKLPTSLLQYGGNGYHSTPDIITDEDSYTDGDGETRRNPLPHTRSKVYLNTVEEVSESEKLVIQEVLNNPIIMNLEYWNDKAHDYKVGKFYMPEIDWKHKNINPITYEITYAGISVTLVEY